jgi:hypothetical protein
MCTELAALAGQLLLRIQGIFASDTKDSFKRSEVKIYITSEGEEPPIDSKIVSCFLLLNFSSFKSTVLRKGCLSAELTGNPLEKNYRVSEKFLREY